MKETMSPLTKVIFLIRKYFLGIFRKNDQGFMVFEMNLWTKKCQSERYDEVSGCTT